MAASAINSVSGSGSIAQALAGNRGLNQEDFLKLLITQLTNQDPLQPQDDKEFIAQMAQFSTVEGVKQITDSMSRLQGASLVGRTVLAQVLKDGAPHEVAGVVQSARFAQDGIHLMVNDQDVTLDQIMQVKA